MMERTFAALSISLGLAATLGAPDRSGLRALDPDSAAATSGAQFGTPHEICANTDADPVCETAFGTACTQPSGSCSWCATAPGSYYRKCVPAEEGECDRVVGGASGVNCGTRFVGTCIPWGEDGQICHGTPSGVCNSAGNLKHECNL